MAFCAMKEIRQTFGKNESIYNEIETGRKNNVMSLKVYILQFSVSVFGNHGHVRKLVFYWWEH